MGMVFIGVWLLIVSIPSDSQDVMLLHVFNEKPSVTNESTCRFTAKNYKLILPKYNFTCIQIGAA